jgi:preprotein translocase subunit YajC
MSFFISDAWAQAPAGGAGEAGGLSFFLPLIVLFVVFYFLAIRPQQKRAKEHRQLLEALKKGDEVVTGGGILGRITKVGDAYLTVEVADGMEIAVQRQSIQQVLPKGTIKSA